jgi:hypothetical protein
VYFTLHGRAKPPANFAFSASAESYDMSDALAALNRGSLYWLSRMPSMEMMVVYAS